MITKPEVTTAIILDTRTTRKNGTYPVKLRVTYQRMQKYYSLKFSFSRDDFNEIFDPKARREFKDYKLLLIEHENKAIEIINNIPGFSFPAFERLYLKAKTTENDIFFYYENTIEKFKGNGQVSTAEIYHLSMNSIKEFAKVSKLAFEFITPEFLTKYEKFNREKGKSYTTISIYLRCLRKIFNEAIAKGTIKSDIYPFGRNKYQVPASRNIKKALAINEIGKIFNYKPEIRNLEEWSRDMWIFSYLSNGMNVADIARLKFKNIENDKIVFYREKTKNTSKQDLKLISVTMLPEIKAIIEKWGNKFYNQQDYIFEILKPRYDPEKQRAAIKQATKTINKYIKRIAKKVGIEKNITTYWARHSFSTVLKNSGLSYEFIGEKLGHHDLKSTQCYLDSFEDTTNLEQLANLTKFNKT